MRITSVSRVGATAALALCTVVGLGGPAYAIDVSGGCSGIAASTDGSGKILQVGSHAGFAMVFALLFAAIIWNLGTWWLGLPASSSHT